MGCSGQYGDTPEEVNQELHSSWLSFATEVPFKEGRENPGTELEPAVSKPLLLLQRQLSSLLERATCRGCSQRLTLSQGLSPSENWANAAFPEESSGKSSTGKIPEVFPPISNLLSQDMKHTGGNGVLSKKPGEDYSYNWSVTGFVFQRNPA